jgi:hypothetical protein
MKIILQEIRIICKFSLVTSCRFVTIYPDAASETTKGNGVVKMPRKTESELPAHPDRKTLRVVG